MVGTHFAGGRRLTVGRFRLNSQLCNFARARVEHLAAKLLGDSGKAGQAGVRRARLAGTTSRLQKRVPVRAADGGATPQAQ